MKDKERSLSDFIFHLSAFIVFQKWAHLDSNQGPTGYEPVALTGLSYGPERTTETRKRFQRLRSYYCSDSTVQKILNYFAS